MNYIDENSYSSDIHVGYKKYAQVIMSIGIADKYLPTISQICWCDEDPDNYFQWGDRVRHVDITDVPDVRCGMVLDPNSPTPNNKNFLDERAALRVLYTDAELKAHCRGLRMYWLMLTDTLVVRHRDQLDLGAGTTLTENQYIELLSFRQALRDFPETADLDNIQLPAIPSFMTPATPPQQS